MRRMLLLLAAISFGGCTESNGGVTGDTLPDTAHAVIGADSAGSAALKATRDTAAPAQTDSMSYAFHARGSLLETQVGYTYRNTTGDSVFIMNCNGAFGVTLELKKGVAWSRFWTPVLPACLSAAIVIAPGSTYRGTVNIAGTQSATGYSDFPAGSLDGVYRLKMDGFRRNYNASRNQYGDTLAVAQRVSNEFVIVTK